MLNAFMRGAGAYPEPCASEELRAKLLNSGLSRFSFRLGRFVSLALVIITLVMGGCLLSLALLAAVRHAALGRWLPALVLAGLCFWIITTIQYIEHGWNFRRSVVWKFRRVCAHVGLVTTQPGRKPETKVTTYPRLVDIVGNKQGWCARLEVIPGQGFKDFEKHIEPFSLAFKASSVRFVLQRGGRAMLYVSAVHEAQAVEDYPYDTAAIEAANVKTALQLLTACPLGYMEGGGEYRVAVLGSHALIAGRTGAGKGSLIWSLILGLAPAVAHRFVRLWGFDPKRVELAIARDWWDEYAHTDTGMVELLEQAVEDMQTRAEWMQGRARKFTPSVDVPLNVLVIDELAYLSNLMSDRKLRDRADKALCLLLTQGRALGYAVVGALQDPRKETLGYRDLFPTRIALSLPAEMVDLVLGKGSREAGAFCDLLPIGEAGAGMGFALMESSPLPVRIRARWCSDELVQMYASLVIRAREWSPRRETEPLENTKSRELISDVVAEYQ